MRHVSQWLLWSKAWANPSVLERRKGEVSALRDFEQDGDLVLCSEFDQDISGVVDIAKRIHDTGRLNSVGLDPYALARWWMPWRKPVSKGRIGSLASPRAVSCRAP